MSSLLGKINLSILFRREDIDMGRKADYSNDIFKQMEEMMASLSEVKSDLKESKKRVRELEKITVSQEKIISELKTENESLRSRCSKLEDKCMSLEKENSLLRNDNERMKRQISNNSNNSSLPPSTDQNPSSNQTKNKDERKPKAPNEYNGRNSSGKKKGGQPGHTGKSLNSKTVEEKIRKGQYEHRINHVGTVSDNYVVRYVLDFDIKVIATEVRIYADENGKYQIPDKYRTEVTYGSGIRSMAACLYSEGVVSNDRICDFINSVSGGVLEISEGCVYGICRQFSDICLKETVKIEEDILNQRVACTDATHMTVNGKQAYIRNVSNEKSVLYYAMSRKTIDELKKIPVLQKFTGILEHDHETALYHFGTRHAECNVHLHRYLKKNTEETGNLWSKNLSSFLSGLNIARKKLIEEGKECFTAEQLARYEARYDEILEQGNCQNQNTKGRLACSEEKKLLKRLKSYKSNHILFLYDFEVPYSDNMSERDLRKCKNRQKMAGGFRALNGMEMYCSIMSWIETIKRRGMNVFNSIVSLFEGKPVIY